MPYHASPSLVALLLLTSLGRPLSAQLPGTGSIQGTVRGPDGPLADATVRLVGADRHAATDRAGAFRLDDVSPGRYTLEISAVGFAADRRTVRVAPDTVIEVNATLQRAAQRLAELTVTGRAPAGPVAALPDVLDGALFAGKKTQVLALDSLDVNAAQDVSRQVLGRVPGLNVSETGGAGFPSNGIGFRGLNPTQSTEVNVRQDGYNIAADPYGYPEAYFIPPAEALSQVELVRGASSLGFGSQFGGVVNYVIRDGTPRSPPVARARFTGASYATFDGFGDVGGGVGPLTYYGFVQYRNQNGWRPNGNAEQAGAPDAVDPATDQFVPREVEREKFTNATLESRLSWSFPLLGRTGTFAAGVRAFAGRMHRQEGGPGSTGSDFDLTLYGGPYEKDVTFYNTNLSGHVEQLVRLGDRLSVLHSSTTGYTDTTFSPLARDRTFALPGVAVQLRTSTTTEAYGSIARSYRPIDYSSITPFATVSRIDPDLRDPKGYTTDLGWRGRLVGSAIGFDVGVFRIRYGDRIGLVSGADPDGTPFTLRTNVGTSVHRGVEAYLDLHPLVLLGGSSLGDIALFNAFAFTDAKYVDGEFTGNRVEYAPKLVNRIGLTYARGAFSGTFQVSHVSRQFGDANNTIGGSDSNVGLVPAYDVLDLTGQGRLGQRFTLAGGVNNLADAHYFTRRTDEYPRPGIIPSPGRSLYLSLGVDF